MSTLPDFTKDITGQYYGGAYWNPAEYRVQMNRPVEATDEEGFLLWVEDSAGNRIGVLWLTPELIDGITSMANTDHSLSGYEDDWKIPAGMDRHLDWTLPTDENNWVVLKSDDIDEVAAWLRYATGEDEYDGDPENWEF